MIENEKNIEIEKAMAEATKKFTDLPEDLIVNDILSRLPVKSLVRFKFASKRWYGFISNPIFVKAQLNRSFASNTNLNLVFIHNHPFKLDSLELDALEQSAVMVETDQPLGFSFNKAEVVGSCNGLLCIVNYSEDDIFIWNPCIRLHQKLPITNPPRDFPTDKHCEIIYGFGYDPNSDDYKVVKIAKSYDFDNFYWHSLVKVYSLNTNAWVIADAIPYEFRNISGHGEFVNSALHWHDFSDKSITCFNLKNNKFRELLLPDRDEDELHFHVCYFEERLCLFREFDLSSHIECWMMEEYGVRESWTKVFSIENKFYNFDITALCFLKNGELFYSQFFIVKDLLMGLFKYDPRTGMITRLRYRHDEEIRNASKKIIHRGSLVPPKPKDRLGNEETYTKT